MIIINVKRETPIYRTQLFVVSIIRKNLISIPSVFIPASTCKEESKTSKRIPNISPANVLFPFIIFTYAILIGGTNCQIPGRFLCDDIDNTAYGIASIKSRSWASDHLNTLYHIYGNLVYIKKIFVSHRKSSSINQYQCVFVSCPPYTGRLYSSCLTCNDKTCGHFQCFCHGLCAHFFHLLCCYHFNGARCFLYLFLSHCSGNNSCFKLYR